jgi:hypothetical protein
MGECEVADGVGGENRGENPEPLAQLASTTAGLSGNEGVSNAVHFGGNLTGRFKSI